MTRRLSLRSLLARRRLSPGVSLATATARPRRARRPLLERLEDRRLLAITASIVGGDVVLTGDASATTTELSLSGSLLAHNRETDPGFDSPTDFDSATPGTQSIAAADVTSLTLVDAAGNDHYKLRNSHFLPDSMALTINGPTFDLFGRSETVGQVTLQAGEIANTSNANPLTASVGFQVETGLVSARLGGGAPLVKTTSGVVTLTNENTVAATISQGVLRVDHAGALGGPSPVTLNDAATGAADTTLLIADGLILPQAIVVANQGTGATTIGTDGGASAAIFSGSLTLNRPVSFQGLNTDRTTFAGPIGGTPGMVTVTGGGRVTWESTNAFVGDVEIVGAGTVLQVARWGGTADQIPDASNVHIEAGATLQTAFTDGERFNGLSGEGTVTTHPDGAGAVTIALGEHDASSTFDGVIKDGDADSTVSLAKYGTGTLILTGNQAYTGETVIYNGVLQIDGATAAASDVRAIAASLLSGSGTIGGTVRVHSRLAPGGGVGVLSTGSVTFDSIAAFEVELGGASPGEGLGFHDQLAVSGSVSITTTELVLSSAGGFVPSPGESYLILDNDGTADAITGRFDDLPEGALIENLLGSGLDATITYFGGDGNDVVIQMPDELTYTGGAANEDYEVRLAGDMLELWVDGSLAESHLAAMVNRWTINAGDGDDTLTVDYSGGEFDAEIVFHGEGEDGPPGDRLVITGASAGVVTHTFVNASDGSIAIDGQRTISYTGLEPITDNLDAADRVFTFTGGSETVTLRDDLAAVAGVSEIVSTLGEVVSFTNPTSSLVVNLTDGADQLNLAGLDPGFDADLTVVADADDAVAITAPTDAGGGAIAITAGAITFDAELTTTADVALSALSGAIDNSTPGLSDVTANRLTADAATGIELDTNVAEVDLLLSQAGAITLDESDSVAVLSAATFSGPLSITAGADIAAGQIAAPGSTATLTAGGAILEHGADASADITAQTILLEAQTGIGTSGTLEIDAGSAAGQGLTATVTGAGLVDIADTNALRVASATTADGPITLRSAGALTAENVAAGGAHPVDLASTGGGVALGSVSAAGDQITVSAAAAITDDNGGGLNLLANRAALSAGGGIGHGNPLETAVSTVAAANTAGGNIELFNSVGGLLTLGAVAPLAGVTNTAGGVSIVNQSPLSVVSDVTASGSITLTAADSAAPGDDLTVDGGVTVQSSSGDVTLRAGDNLLLPGGSVVSAPAGSLALAGDFGDADPGLGATISLAGTLVSSGAAQGIAVAGGPDDDLITLDPDAGGADSLAIDGAAGDDSYEVFLGNLTGGADAVALLDAAGEGTDDLTVHAESGGATLDIDAASLTSGGETISYTSALESLEARGGAGSDTFNIAPSVDLAISVLGGDPAAPATPGDILAFTTPGGETATFSPSGGDSGTVVTTGGFQQVVFDEIETFGFAGAVVINGTADDDHLVVDATAPTSGSMVLITAGVAGPTIHFAGMTSLTFNGLAGDDVLTINQPDGTFLAPVDGIAFHGGTEDGDGNALGIAGASGDTLQINHALPAEADLVSHTFTNDSDGSLSIVDAGTGVNTTVTYTGLEPILDNLAAAQREFTFTGGSESVTLSPVGLNGQHNLIDSTLGESVSFNNPSGSLTIHLTGGADTLDLAGLDAGFDSDLTVTQDGGDTLNVVAATDIGSGDFNLAADSIQLDAPLSTTANATLTAAAGAIVDGNGPAVNLIANTLSASAVSGIDLDTTLTTVASAIVSGVGDLDLNDTAGGLNVTSASTADGAVTVVADGGNLVLGAVTAGGAHDLVATTTTSGNILAGNVTASGDTVTLTAAGAINESGADAGSDITARVVLLSAVSGIGSSGQIEINAGDAVGDGLSASVSGAGAINLRDVSGVRVNSATTANGGITLIAASGSMHLALVSAGGGGNVTASTLGGSGDLSVDTVTAVGNTATLAAFDELQDANGAGTVNVTAAVLVASAGGALELDTDVATLSATTSGAGGITLREADGVDLLNVVAANGPIDFTQAGPGDVAAVNVASQTDDDANDITLATLAGDLTVTTINAGTLAGDVTITKTSGAILDDGVNATRITADRLSISNSGGGIGAPGGGGQIDTRVNSVDASAVGGSIHLGELDGLTLSTATATGAGNDVLVTSSTGDIEVVAVAAPDLVSLDATAGGITDGSPGEAAQIVATNLALRAASGIGSADDLNVSVSNLAAENDSAGDIQIANDLAGLLTLGPVDGIAGVNNNGPGGLTVIHSGGHLAVAASSAAGGDVTLTASDAAAAGQNLTVGPGVVVASVSGGMLLNAGDDFLLDATASLIASAPGQTITINGDFGDADPGVGTTVDLDGTVTTDATGNAVLNGGPDSDLFDFAAQSTSSFSVHGMNPVSPVTPGDLLQLDIGGTTDPLLTVNGFGDGSFTFAPPNRQVAYTSIETVDSGGVPYHLALDNPAAPYGDDAVADQITVRRNGGPAPAAGTQLVLERTGAGAPVGVLYQGDISEILSLTLLGSGDDETVTIDDVHGLPDLASTILPALDNPNIAGAPEMLIEGGGGLDRLHFALAAAPSSQQLAIGDGSGAAQDQGELLTDNGLNALTLYFNGLSAIETSGAAGGDLDVYGDAAGNTIEVEAAGGFTRVRPLGYATFDFQVNKFDTFNLYGMQGGDTLDLISLAAGETGLAVLLDGDTPADTDPAADVIRLRSLTAANSVLLLGGAGDDEFQLFDAGNTVDNLAATVPLDGEAGVDTLVVIDSGDATADTITLDTATIQGITSFAGADDVSYSGIEHVNVTGTADGDTFHLDLTAASGVLTATLNGSGGDDTFTNVTSGFGNADYFSPSMTTEIFIHGDSPTAPASPGDTLRLDMSGALAPVIVDTVGGLAISQDHQDVHFTSIETIFVFGVPGIEIGDLYVRGTVAADRIIFFQWQFDEYRVDITRGGVLDRFGPYFPTRKLIVYGREGNDRVIVNGPSALAAEFYGETGNDYLASSLGDDTLNGGLGNDKLLANEGDNTLIGGDANDFLEGRGGADVITGNDGNDELLGGDGDDLLEGNAGNDRLFGHLGDDLLRGGSGNDTLRGGAGNDILLGEAGDDELRGEQGFDLLIGGEGADIVYGNNDGDILIGGTTAHDNNDAALRDIVAAWEANALLAARVAAITAGVGGSNAALHGGTVNDDGLEDLLIDSSGEDWFLAFLSDQVLGYSPANDELTNL